MKIGILTQPLINNYGGLLQAYALQTSLKQFGHDAIILDRHFAQQSRIKVLLHRVKAFIFKYVFRHLGIEVIPFQLSPEQRDTISKETRRFVQQHINKTEKLYSTNDLKRVVSMHAFDAYIVGSDQVWRLTYSPCITNYFLDFIDRTPSVKRIAYAASFGVDHWHFSAKETQKCKQLAQQFDAISVREDTGVDLCRKHLAVDALHVLDPTMLLDPEDYRGLVLADDVPQSTGNLMAYVLDSSVEKNSVIQQVATTLKLKPFTVMPLLKFGRETQGNIKDCVFPPVTQWLRGFMDAEFVVADSFHGCVFAILFNIPFVVIGNKQRGMARFVSLLRQFNLQDRLIDSSSELTEKLIRDPVDWNQVNHQRSTLKEFSLHFLRVNLETSSDLK